MKSKSFGLYLMLGILKDKQCNKPDRVVKFDRPVKIVGISGTISSFPRLHVQFLLTLSEDNSFWKDKYGIEESDDVFVVFNCGNAGVGTLPLSMGLDIVTDKICLWCWAHNMYLLPKDFHGSYTVYYEEISRRSRIIRRLKSLFT